MNGFEHRMTNKEKKEKKCYKDGVEEDDRVNQLLYAQRLEPNRKKYV